MLGLKKLTCVSARPCFLLKFFSNVLPHVVELENSVNTRTSNIDKNQRKLSYNQQKMGAPLRAIQDRLLQLAPLNLAESWDNVGLLIEPQANSIVSNIMLTIDLTEAVLDEALQKNIDLIITYHPLIFKDLTNITQSNWKQRIITKCIKDDIAVFSPHTSWDAMDEGVNDWLAACLKPKESKAILVNTTNNKQNIGMGRYLVLETPITLKKAIDQVKLHIEQPNVQVAIAKGKNLDSLIETAAVCAGSGGKILQNVSADLYITGEMSHHELLDAAHDDVSVILCNHSNSERGFLRDVQKRLQFEGVKTIVSQTDKDPLTVF